MSILQTRTNGDTKPATRSRDTLFAALYFTAIVVAMGGWLYFLFRVLAALVAWLVT